MLFFKVCSNTRFRDFAPGHPCSVWTFWASVCCSGGISLCSPCLQNIFVCLTYVPYFWGLVSSSFFLYFIILLEYILHVKRCRCCCCGVVSYDSTWDTWHPIWALVTPDHYSSDAAPCQWTWESSRGWPVQEARMGVQATGFVLAQSRWLNQVVGAIWGVKQ